MMGPYIWVSSLGLHMAVIQVIVASNSINETQVMEQRIFSFGIKEQMMVMLQNVNDVNKERTCLAGGLAYV